MKKCLLKKIFFSLQEKKRILSHLLGQNGSDIYDVEHCCFGGVATILNSFLRGQKIPCNKHEVYIEGMLSQYWYWLVGHEEKTIKLIIISECTRLVS